MTWIFFTPVDNKIYIKFFFSSVLKCTTDKKKNKKKINYTLNYFELRILVD